MFINVCGSSKLPLPGGWTKGQVPPEVRTALCWPACAGWGRRGGCWVLHARKQGLLGGGCCCLYPACCCSRPTQPDARPRILSAITPIAGEAAPGGEAGWRGARRHARVAQLGPATHRSRPPGSALPGWVLPLLMSGGAACCMSARWQRSLDSPGCCSLQSQHGMLCLLAPAPAQLGCRTSCCVPAVADCIFSSEMLERAAEYRPLKLFLIQLALGTTAQKVGAAASCGAACTGAVDACKGCRRAACPTSWSQMLADCGCGSALLCVPLACPVCLLAGRS